MHLPLAHLSGFEDGEDEELQAQLQAHSVGSGHEDEEGSQSHSQGSKEGSGGSAGPAGSGGGGDGGDGSGKPPKDLPCPRCQSMNTKFCYYNNYSVNQPRHFCRNCQRYWTVGGTLRNVPVGGGSRKKTRTRSRSDPYYRPPAPSASDDSEHAAMAGAMAGEIHPGEFEAGAFGDFPFHPAAFLQLAAGMGMGDPFQAPPFGMGPEDEAELQAVYEASQGGFLSSAAAMMSAGLFLPELEPAHLALMHKATLWAEAQRLQTMARRQAWAAAEEQRECKPSVAGPNPTAMAANRHQRRPGFWETALMHSRPSSKAAPLATRPPPPPPQPGSTSSSTPPPPATPGTPWGDAETKPPVLQEDPAAAYSSLVDEQTTSWGSGPDMYC